MDDPYVLGPGLAPTPFTAEQIRAGCPDGHTVFIRTTEAGEVSESVQRFDAGDADGVTLTRQFDGDSLTSRVSWRDLQAHAAFPSDFTTRVQDTIASPLGTLDCLRYEIAGEPPMRFWFALDHPGMPVRYTDGNSTTEVVRIERVQP
ncbi:hypothetical protein [Microlunatus soli]|uniref:Uncharacterized protein n=1 Tax=Microlunatus soli TaxID=630515 RepID=A0A1H1SBS3_9ACTN|nr:hypothetical protein [Microlunatus soli]SDS45196.1 hypothetical protein SAMN04489812_1947 [Microlunatus soli]